MKKLLLISSIIIAIAAIYWYYNYNRKKTIATQTANLTPAQTTIQVQPVQHITTGTKA